MNKDRKLQFFIIIFFIIIFFRYYYFQVHEYTDYEIKAGNNSLRSILVFAPRGIIYDRNGIPLVDNRQVYDLSVIPFDVTKKFNYKLLNRISSLSIEELKNDILIKQKSFNRFRPYTILRHLDFETRSRLEENKLDFPGAMFSEFPARSYPNSARLTHVLGYLRAFTDGFSSDNNNLKYKAGDIFGFSGIEKMYEPKLRGINGAEFRLVDIYGIDHGKYKNNPGVSPVPGKDLYITIDSKLQSYIENLFDNRKGTVICMVPSSGEILGYLSSPDYDLNSFAGPVPIELWQNWNQDSEKPLLNRGIQGLYPPGSTFKLIALALALEKNLINSNWIVNCNGVYHYGDRNFHCWNVEGHGEVALNKAIYQSCNIYFYHLMQKLSLNEWKELAEKFGFGSITGIDLLGEKPGIVPSRKYLNQKYGKYGWAGGNLLTFVIGQGDILVTPIQVIQMMNIISTRGQISRPHFYLESSFDSLALKLKASTWDHLQHATFEVVNHANGTGKAAAISNGVVHGKTGTAQNPHGDDHSWFAGYLIYNQKPIFSLVVLVEHGGKGSVEAASISSKIFKYAEENYY